MWQRLLVICWQMLAVLRVSRYRVANILDCIVQQEYMLMHAIAAQCLAKRERRSKVK